MVMNNFSLVLLGFMIGKSVKIGTVMQLSKSWKINLKHELQDTETITFNYQSHNPQNCILATPWGGHQLLSQLVSVKSYYNSDTYAGISCMFQESAE